MKADRPGRRKGLKIATCKCGQRVTGRRGSVVDCAGCGKPVRLTTTRRARKKVAEPLLLPYRKAAS